MILAPDTYKLNKIQEVLKEVLSDRPTYGDTELDVLRLQAKQDLAEELMEIITKP